MKKMDSHKNWTVKDSKEVTALRHLQLKIQSYITALERPLNAFWHWSISARIFDPIGCLAPTTQLITVNNKKENSKHLSNDFLTNRISSSYNSTTEYYLPTALGERD
jgi:hypothetical protein